MNAPAHPFPALSRTPWLAVAEVFAVYCVGAVLGILLARLAGVDLRNPMLAIAADPEQDLVPIAIDLLNLLFWQYLGWFLCIGLMRLLRGALPSDDAPAPRLGARALIGLGLIAGCLTSLPSRLIMVAHDWLQLGETAPWRAALLGAQWDLDFWLLMAVGSFGLIPFVEELFYRGYVLKRLRASMSMASALVLAASLFAFSHAQYLRVDALNVVTLASVVFSGLVYGLVVLHARSLWPAIIGHVIINVPVLASLNLVVAAAMLLFLVLSWPQWRALRAFARECFAGQRALRLLAMAALGAGLALTFHLVQELALLTGALLLLALIGGYRWYLRRLDRQGVRPDVAVHA
jgi:membrane protease YdiL (CAAX protease family)